MFLFVVLHRSVFFSGAFQKMCTVTGLVNMVYFTLWLVLCTWLYLKCYVSRLFSCMLCFEFSGILLWLKGVLWKSGPLLDRGCSNVSLGLKSPS